MSYRDVVIGSARAHLTNPDARGQSIAWFNSMVVAEKNNYGYSNGPVGEDAKWCAIFVSWCAAQAGILNNIVPFECSTQDMYAKYQNTGRSYTDRSQATYGDVVFLNSGGNAGNGINHVAYVVSMREDCVVTIEGNNTLGGTDPNGVVETKWSHSAVVGYGKNIIDFSFYKGHFDQLTNTTIAGWAWNGYDDTAVNVHIYIWKDGVFKANVPVLANKYRADLQAAGIGNGNHSFTYNINLYYVYGAGSYVVRVYMITNGINPQVSNSPLSVYVSNANAAQAVFLEEESGKCIFMDEVEKYIESEEKK